LITFLLFIFIFNLKVKIQSSGEKINQNNLMRHIGYVPQEDILDRNLTVRELLEFNLRSRVQGLNETHVSNMIESVLSDLSIEKIADSIIGGGENASANISGGQLKRVNIACELVKLTRPAALLLDEPTSGASFIYYDSIFQIIYLYCILHISN